MQFYPKIRLFVEPVLAAGGEITCRDEQAHYLIRVMRLKAGDPVALFNGSDGEWFATVTEVRKKELTLVVERLLRPYLPPCDGWLCFAPLKFGRIDYLAQKATELGVSCLQPVITHYTQAERVKIDRLRANAIEAAEQCERVEVPEVAQPVNLPHLLADWPKDRMLLVADESGGGVALKDWIGTVGKVHKWAILIGPEGGFSPEERSLFDRVPQVVKVGLGPRILRADTAAIALLAILQCNLGDWQLAPRFGQEQ